MRANQLIVASLLAVSAAASFAAGPAKDYISPATLGTSVRTREAVVAETTNARAQGLQLGGDIVEAKAAPVVTAEAAPLTRAEVRAAVAAARADHTLARNGEL